jgi:3-oxoacyl-[acyl-carrier protein] reductase
MAATDVSAAARVAVVTGAAGGMGSHIARRLHSDGYRVMLTDVNLDAAQRLAVELSPDASTARAAQHDVAHRQAFVDVLALCRQTWDTPAVLVNNAAITQAADLMTLGEDDFSRVLSTNVNSVFFGCQVFGAAMADRGYGRIVNMASLAGQNGGTATGGHYASSKGAILTATKIFARELAARGVTVNAIAPGPHDLPVVRQTVPADKLDGVIAAIPVGALGNPAFIGDVVGLLASEGASFVTGACWDVNGGLYLR